VCGVLTAKAAHLKNVDVIEDLRLFAVTIFDTSPCAQRREGQRPCGVSKECCHLAQGQCVGSI